MTKAAREIWEEKLEFLRSQEAIASDPGQKFTLKQQIEEALAKLAELAEDPKATPAVQPRIDLNHLPAGAADFLGRAEELRLLDQAWAESGRTQLVTLIAPGGVGKTALVKRWLDRLKAEGWCGAARVYGWSFFSKGSREDREASDDAFLDAALRWFCVAFDPALPPWDKGLRLAEALAAGRNLLVLDGVEPLQYPPGPLAGELRAPGLQALLHRLAGGGQPGLCLLTSRERIADLREYERGEDHPAGAVLRHELSNLSEAEGARLLHKLGVRRAGDAEIAGDDEELKAASREVHGHALTLGLLGGYLALAHEGDVRRRDQVRLREADAELRGGRAFQVMAAYEHWFQGAGEAGARELAALRLLGFFDRPADPACLAVLRTAPPIPGLTEPLADLGPAQWNLTLGRLQGCGLIEKASGGWDAHPLVREYLAAVLRERRPEAWREGHRRLYVHLKAAAPHRPESLSGLQPLYQAVAHGCLAGLRQAALNEVYRDRILRGTGGDGFYSWRKLGAFGANLGAVACFFEEIWRRPSPALAEADRAWLLGEAAFYLRGLGRLAEALEPMRSGLEMGIRQEEWKNAAIAAGNLSELELALGRVAEAVADAARAVEAADRSGDAFQRISKRTTLADARHQGGESVAALAGFREAESLQAARQPGYPLLYSLRGFQYCDLLLAEAERAAWRAYGSTGVSPVAGSGRDAHAPLAACQSVEERAAKALGIVLSGSRNLLDIGLNHLTLARARLLRAVLDGAAFGTPAADLAPAAGELEAAVSGFRAAGQQQEIPRGLLARAWLHALAGRLAAARADLDEAGRIAARGGMRLHLADVHLHRARIFRDRAALAAARALIEACGYGRRLPELEDAEAAARNWPWS